MQKSSPLMPVLWMLFLMLCGGISVVAYRYAAINPQVGAPVVTGTPAQPEGTSR